MNRQKHYWERLAKRNAKYYIANFKGKDITDEEFDKSGFDDFKEHILKDELIPFRGVAIDLGCGIGRITEFMAYKWAKVIGIDISSEMIRRARERWITLPTYRYGDIEYIETNGDTIPLPDNTVDFVFSYLVFQHIKFPTMVENNFREVHRVLKPEGIFKVLMRHEIEPMKWWNSGIAYDDKTIKPLIKGFKLLKTTYTPDCYTFWLWLEKK